jgi:hypothetical protein
MRVLERRDGVSSEEVLRSYLYSVLVHICLCINVFQGQWLLSICLFVLCAAYSSLKGLGCTYIRALLDA